MKAIGPYSVSRKAGELVFVSGQIGLDQTSGELVSGGVEAEAKQALLNLGEALKACGLGYENVVKTTVFLADIGDFAAVNAIYASFFKEPFPARSAVGVGGLPKGARVEVEAVAFAGVTAGVTEKKGEK